MADGAGSVHAGQTDDPMDFSAAGGPVVSGLNLADAGAAEVAAVEVAVPVVAELAVDAEAAAVKADPAGVVVVVGVLADRS